MRARVASRKPALVIEKAAERLSKAGQWAELALLLNDYRSSGRWNTPQLQVHQAEASLHLGNPHEAVAIANDLLSLANVPTHLSVKALLVRSSASRLRGFFQAAVEDARAATSLLQDTLQPVEIRIECHRQLAAALGTMGDLDEAVQELTKGLELCAKSSDLSLMAVTEDNMAIALAQLGQLSEALVYFERAKAAYRKLENTTNLARVLNNIGRLYYDLGQYDASLEALTEGLAAARASKSARLEGSLMVNTGDTLQHMTRLDEALHSYQQALNLAEEVLEPRLFCQANIGAGNTYARLKDFPKARVFLGKAVFESKKLGLRYEHSSGLLHLGILSLNEGAYKDALAQLDEVVSQFEAIGARRELLKGYVYLALLCLKTKRWVRLNRCLKFIGTIVRNLDLKDQLILECQETPEIVEYAASKRIEGSLFQEIRDRQAKRLEIQVPELPAISGETGGHTQSLFPMVEIHSLGDSFVQLDDRRVAETEWRSQKAKELFMYLLCNRRGATREQLLEVLWPDMSAVLSRNALYNNVYRVRKALYEQSIVQEDGRYKLNPQGSFWFDLHEFQALIDQAEKLPGGSPERADRLQAAIKLYRGSFLEDFYAEWCNTIRFQAEAKYLQSLARLAGHRAAEGQYDEAITLLESLLKVDETNPDVHEQIVKTLIKRGDVESARLHYNQFRAVVQEQRGQEVMKSFQQLRQEAA